MIPTQERPHSIEVQFTMPTSGMESLRRHTDLLHRTAKALYDQSTVEKGLVKRLRDDMAGEVEETAVIYEFILTGLNEGNKLTIRPSSFKKTPQQRSTYDLDPIWGRMSAAPFPTDFELEIRYGSIFQGESIVVDDLISTVFFQSNPHVYEGIRDALRSGQTISLIPQTPTQKSP